MRSEYEANLALYTKPVNRELMNERKPIRPDEKPAAKLADPAKPQTWAVL